MSQLQSNILFCCLVLIACTVFIKAISWDTNNDEVKKAESILNGAKIIQARNQLNEINRNQKQINAYTTYCIKHNTSSVPSLDEIAICKNSSIRTTLGYSDSFSEIREKAALPLPEEFKKYVH